VFQYGTCKWRVVQPKSPIGGEQLGLLHLSFAPY